MWHNALLVRPQINWLIFSKKLFCNTFSGNVTCDFIVKVAPTDQEAVLEYGAPPLFYIHYTYSPDQDKSISERGVCICKKIVPMLYEELQTMV